MFFLSPTPSTRISIFGSNAVKRQRERGVISSTVCTRHESTVLGNKATGPYLQNKLQTKISDQQKCSI